MKNTSFVLATSLFVLSLLLHQAQAQAPAPATNSPYAAVPESQQADVTLGVIVVTAQRREENIQNVPIAITALDQQQLQTAGVSDTFNLKAAVPGLNIATASAYALPQIRGIGTGGGGPGVENPVAVYIDGVYIANASGALLRLNDIEQVAVLKGPQGTLFGRNATGGVIQITTRSPQQKFSANISGTVANVDTYGGDAFITGGLAPDLAASASVSYNNQQHGFGSNLFTGKDVDDGNNFAGRARLLWTPGDATRISLNGDYSRYHGRRPALATINDTFTTGHTPHVGGYWDTFTDFPPDQTVEQEGGSVTIQHDLSDSLRFLSISAYRQSLTEFQVDNDGSVIPFVAANVTVRQTDQQFSQEVQLQSIAAGKFKWTIGAYYYRARAAADPVNLFGPFLALVPGLPPGVDTSSVLGTQHIESIAGFAQGTYEIFDNTNLTLGTRYTTEQRKLSQSQLLLGNGAVIVPIHDDERFKADFDRPTWRASLDHRFSPDVLAYISFNSGFKSGFFNVAAFDSASRLVKPEFLDAYEIGVKTDLLDHRLRFNAAAFYYDYKNIQAFYIIRGLGTLANGKGATSHGIDADVTWRVTPELTLTAGAAWLHARYDEFPNALRTTSLPGGGNAVTFDLDATGNVVQLAPTYTGNAGFSYTIPFLSNDSGSVTVAANYYHNDGFFADPQNRVKQSSYNTVDASLTWAAPEDRYSVRLWARNLTNEQYALGLYSVEYGDLYEAAPGRTYGVTAGVRF